MTPPSPPAARWARLLAVLLLAGPLLAGGGEPRVLTQEEAGYEAYLRYAPTGPAGRLDWLLVTPAALKEAFAPLVAHRREQGLAAEAVSLETVAADVLLGGGDLPERLRNLVRELHDRYGLRYLLLGGDSDVLPPRMVPLGLEGENVHHGEPFAADAYFGCLDGEWNADADARFGEAEAAQQDAVDVEHEVHVGRVPVDSVREAETWVRKVLRYERPEHLDYQDRVAYLGGTVFVEDDADRFYRALHEERFGPKGFAPSYFTRAGEGSRPTDVLKALSEGVGVVCHYHHSFTYNLGLPTGALDTGNYLEVTNEERPFVLYSNGCYANQFTKEGISERLLLSPAGGAVAFIGSTNTCFTSSLQLERAFWGEVFEGGATRLGEALSRVRGRVPQGYGVMGFLRLSVSLLGDPATPLWTGRPRRPAFRVVGESDGALRVVLEREAEGPLRATCVQDGPFGAWREPLDLAPGEEEARWPAVVGNGSPLRVTLLGDGIVPSTKEVRDPVRTSVEEVTPGDDAFLVRLRGGEEVRLPLPASIEPGPLVLEGEAGGARLRVVVPVLDGADRGFVRDEETVLFPGFGRMARTLGARVPLATGGEPRVLDPQEAPALPSDLPVEVEAAHDRIRLGWTGAVGGHWLVERIAPEGARLLTPVPLVNPVLELDGLEPLTRLTLAIRRLGAPGEVVVEAATTFPYQVGFPQRIGANVTSVQVLDLDGRRGLEVVFGDDRLGLWALHDDGREVRHAGDNWTFGLFAAIESGVFEPVLANVAGSRTPELLATSKLQDRKLYAFSRNGRPLDGFPVSFRSRLMTPPLVGDFDGKRGVEILVVSGFGRTVELVRPDGRKEDYAQVGQFNYAYPIAVNLDRDRPLEVVLLDGDGKVWALDQGGEPMEGFPVDLGWPGRATPMVANLDRDRALEIVAAGKGTTRLAVIDGRSGEVQADLAVPGAGEPANHSFFYPGLADLTGDGTLSIVLGTPSRRLFAFDLVGGTDLSLRDGFPLDLPAEARGVAAVDVDGDGRDELFLSLHDGQVWGLSPDGELLDGFPLRTRADTYAVPLLEDLDGDGDLELFLGAADGVLRAWDLPYRLGRRVPTWRGLQNGAGMPGRPGRTGR